MTGTDRYVRFRLVDEDGYTKIFQDECYPDICDCDIGAKDACEDCECGLAWIIEKSFPIFGIANDKAKVLMLEDKYLNG